MKKQHVRKGTAIDREIKASTQHPDFCRILKIMQPDFKKYIQGAIFIKNIART